MCLSFSLAAWPLGEEASVLCYFRCKKCGQVSDLLLESEAKTLKPVCNTCKTTGGSEVETKRTFAFAFGCRTCWKTWRWCTPSNYATAKAARPDCPQCKNNKEIYFIPSQVTKKKAEKRQRPGMLDDPQHDPSRYDTLDVEANLVGAKRTKREELAKKEEDFFFTPMEDPSFVSVSRMEGTYKQQRVRQKKFLQRFGEMKPGSDPQKTSELTTGRVIPKSTYDAKLKYKADVKGTKYPKMNASAPTVVTDVRVIPRSSTWDYRELGPNSFLRRLSSILYMIHFGVDDRGLYDKKRQAEAYKQAAKEFKSDDEKYKPVEVQTMWAGNSLYLSTNNNLFSALLLEALQTKTTVQALVADINLGSGGTYKSLPRNFTSDHVAKVKEYQQAIITNTESAYRSYFLFQWTYVFQQLREAVEFTNISSVTIKRSGTHYDSWTIDPGDKALMAKRVFVVLPETDTPSKGLFVTKEVHAEELFYPILMELDAKGRLTEQSPAFVGGVKTACFTCAMVLNAASRLLQKKLILPTDAYGHYWENSGKHVSALTFTPNTQTLVFSDNTTSHNVYDTEMPWSPKSPEHK